MMEIHSRRGFALPAAVFALVVVGVLVTGGFYLARQETRIGMASERATAAFYLAERGAAEVMAEWDMSTFGSLSPWASAYKSETVDDGVWSVAVTKMTDRLYFLLSTGMVTQGSGMLGVASRMTAIVARLNTPTIEPRAALSTVGSITVGGSSQIVGTDSIPQQWPAGYCDPTQPPKPGILVDSLSNVTTEGKSHVVEGNPPMLEQNTLTSDSLLLSCGDYFPVIHAQGDLIVEASDYGQGILLVEGDLTFKGGFEFFGPVIVRGTVITEGTGGHFNGGLIAANVALNASSVLGAAVIQYSSCTISRAVLNSSLTRVRPLQDRSWVDLSSVISG